MSKSQLDFSKHREKSYWRTFTKSQPFKVTSVIQIQKLLSHSQIPFLGIAGTKIKQNKTKPKTVWEIKNVTMNCSWLKSKYHPFSIS